MRSLATFLILLPLAGLFSGARADTFILLDGNTIDGDIVAEDDQQITIKGRFGKTVLKRSEIREIQKKKSPRDGYLERLAEIEKDGRNSEASAWVSLGKYAKKEGLREEMQEAFAKALKLEPDNAEAHAGLGQIRHLGSWIGADEKRKLDGGNEAPAAAPAAVPAAPAENPAVGNSGGSGLAQTGMKSVSAGSSKRVQCSACGGTGVAQWFECKQCKRSPKPGYTGMGERLELCRTCAGTAKLPGVPCKVCRTTGKVDPDHPLTAAGVEIIKGYHVCGTCGGKGYDSWIECKQCKRSPAPGWLDMNGIIEMCNRCYGEGKLPGTVCKECGGKGVLRDK